MTGTDQLIVFARIVNGAGQVGTFLRVGYVVFFTRSNQQTLLFPVRVMERLHTADRNLAGACNFLSRIHLITT